MKIVVAILILFGLVVLGSYLRAREDDDDHV
jgi:hypothetical protein